MINPVPCNIILQAQFRRQEQTVPLEGSLLETGRALRSFGMPVPISLTQEGDSPLLTLTTAEFDSFSPDREKVNARYCLRGRNIYAYTSVWEETLAEPARVFILAISLLCGNVVVRILIQGIAYHFFQAIRAHAISSFLDRHFACAYASEKYSYLKALPALAAHLVLTILSISLILIPGTAHIFNLLQGDVDRWAAGHNAEDVYWKSRRFRLHEAFYLTVEHQPEARLGCAPTQGIFAINEPTSDIPECQKRVLLQQIAKGCWDASAGPDLYRDGVRVYDSFVRRARAVIRRIFGYIVDLPLAVLSFSYRTGESIPANRRILYVNGMYTQFSEAQTNAQMLSEYSGGVQVVGVYNPTQSFLRDGMSYICRARDYFSLSIPSSRIVRKIRTFHRRHEADPSAKLLIISHSGGATEVRNALWLLAPEERQRVISIAFAPSALIAPELCYASHHYAIRGDSIPIYAAQNRPDLSNQIHWLPRPRGTNPHYLDNPAFAPIIEQHTRAYLAS